MSIASAGIGARKIYEIKDTLPCGFADLRDDSVQGGHKFLQKLEGAWQSGGNRFNKSGECLLAVDDGGVFAAIGGINIDPYLNNPDMGRIRHLYVHSGFRRRGLASAILTALEKHAVLHFTQLTLRTHSPEAGLFYEALGFHAVRDNAYVTHRKGLVDQST
ncbi:MAG: GNAT family N-acetyltransferase [Alphaproteobacteria bacterium]|nr:GNAT family N-acetyltransferase [Alphaproteobacteria bacterium]